MQNRSNLFVITLSREKLIIASLYLFVFLYNVPITIIIPDIIRKPLLILGLVFFLIGIMLINFKYAFAFLLAVGIEGIFYFLTWSAKLSFGSYMFPAAVSIEFLICALIVLDGRISLTKTFVVFFIIATLITAVTTILGLIEYPTAIRTLGMASNEYNSYWQDIYRKKNIAGWGLLFSMAFSSGTLFHLYKSKKNIFILITLIIDVICVVMSQLMFAILMTGIILFLVFINGKNKSVVLRTMPFLILFILFWLERASILMFLYNIVKDTDLRMLGLRIQNLYDLLVLRDTAGDAGSRFELYSMSLGSFLNHPFGRFFVPSSNVLTEIGFHSEFCDVLGTLGLGGLIIIIILVISILKKLKYISNNVEKRYYAAMVGMFFLMFIINPIIPYPQIWMSTLLIPAIVIQLYPVK